MAAKLIRFRDNARQSIVVGLNKLGPKGSAVVLEPRVGAQMAKGVASATSEKVGNGAYTLSATIRDQTQTRHKQGDLRHENG